MTSPTPNTQRHLFCIGNTSRPKPALIASLRQVLADRKLTGLRILVDPTESFNDQIVRIDRIHRSFAPPAPPYTISDGEDQPILGIITADRLKEEGLPDDHGLILQTHNPFAFTDAIYRTGLLSPINQIAEGRLVVALSAACIAVGPNTSLAAAVQQALGTTLPGCHGSKPQTHGGLCLTSSHLLPVSSHPSNPTSRAATHLASILGSKAPAAPHAILLHDSAGIYEVSAVDDRTTPPTQRYFGRVEQHSATGVHILSPSSNPHTQSIT
jgi:hypothetical protein